MRASLTNDGPTFSPRCTRQACARDGAVLVQAGSAPGFLVCMGLRVNRLGGPVLHGLSAARSV